MVGVSKKCTQSAAEVEEIMYRHAECDCGRDNLVTNTSVYVCIHALTQSGVFRKRALRWREATLASSETSALHLPD